MHLPRSFLFFPEAHINRTEQMVYFGFLSSGGQFRFFDFYVCLSGRMAYQEGQGCLVSQL